MVSPDTYKSRQHADELVSQGWNSMTQNEPSRYIGVDIAKKNCDVFFPGLKRPNRRYCMTPVGLRRFTAVLATIDDPFVVMEATGGYEQPLVEHLHQTSIPLAVVNPKWIRDFAGAGGQLAKTDQIDARQIAEYGRCFRPAAQQPKSQTRKTLGQLITRRDQLISLRTQELSHAEAPVTRSPPATRASFVARATDVPRVTAANTGCRPAIPTTAQTTMST